MKYLNALNKIPGVGSQKMKMLMDYFGTAENIWKSSFENILKAGLTENLANIIIQKRPHINPDKEWEKIQKENIKTILLTDEEYPKLLKEIVNPPYILYIRGEFDFNAAPLITIVGSRKCTPYGERVALSFGRELAQAGITVVSGLAFGIDAAAHRGALEARGKTIAVLGSGLSDPEIGPRINFELSRKIMESGALLSELSIDTPSAPGSFPARNRIMAGLSLGTIVIEAARESGSLITSRLALDFNREVFAVPGSIFSPASEGTNDLLKSGAKLAGSIKDILEELNLEKMKAAEEVKHIIPETEEEKAIVSVLSIEPTHIDKIIKLSKLKTPAVSSTLAILEMKGIIKDIGGQNYIIL